MSLREFTGIREIPVSVLGEIASRGMKRRAQKVLSEDPADMA
jgi:hypothetical protein